MSVNILTSDQTRFLEAVGSVPHFVKRFYLTGGTPLAAFYLQHRFSEDLDFFSEQEVDAQEVHIFLEAQKKKLGIKKIEMEQSFNRNLFFLEMSGGLLKTEFTYFPFTRLEKSPEKKFLIEIDSPRDIAVNKLFTIYNRTKARDYIDLYLLCKEYGFAVTELIAFVRSKFDTHMDPIQLGSQFLKAEKAEDMPRMIIDLPVLQWQTFFRKEALGLEKSIFSS